MNKTVAICFVFTFSLHAVFSSARAEVSLLNPPLRDQITLPNSTNINDLKFVNDSVLIAVTGYTRNATPSFSANILRSNDYGSTWEIVLSDTTRHAEKIAVSPSGKIFVFMSREGNYAQILTSDDAGIQWEVLSDLPEIEKWYIPFAMFEAYSDDNIVVAVMDSGAVMKTENGGQDWEPDRVHESVNYLQSIVTYNNLQYILDGDQKVFFKNLEDNTVGILANPHYGTRKLCVSPAGLLLAYGIGALQYFDEETEQWVKCGKPFSSTGVPLDMAFVSDNLGYAVGEARLLYKTIDGGRNWTAVDNPGISNAPNIKKISFSSTGKGIAADLNAEWFMVYEAGSLISPPVASFIANPISGKAPLAVNFTDSSSNSPSSWKWDFNGDEIIDDTSANPTFVFETPGTYSVTLTVSNDYGTDVYTLNTPVTVEEGISIPGDTIISIGSGDTLDLKPLNLWNDETFGQYIYTDSELGNTDTIFAIAIYKQNTGFEGAGKALTYNDCKIRLNNTSDNIFEISSGSGDNSMGYRDTTGILCFEGTINVPENNGWVWIPFETPFVKSAGQNISVLIQHATNDEDMNDNVKWLHTKTETNRTLSGYGSEIGFLAKTVLDIKFAASLNNGSGTILNQKVKLIQNQLLHYPNPVTSLATINFSLPSPQTVSIKVINFHGKTVFSTGEKLLNAGLNQLQVDCNNLVPGTYFYVLKTNKESFKKKMIVIQK